MIASRHKVNEVYSPLKRKRGNRVPAIVYIAVLAIIYPYLSPKEKSVAQSSLDPDKLAVVIADSWFATQTAVFDVLPAPTSTIMPIVTSTVTPVLTSTQLPVQIYPLPLFDATATPRSDVLYAELSFYDPHIGYYFPDIASINCLQWDVGLRDCVSKVNNNNDDYRQWYRKGFACDFWMEIGTVIYVETPVQLQGYWRCIDRGAGVTGYLFDFMLEYPVDIWTGPDLNVFPWRDPVYYYIVSQ